MRERWLNHQQKETKRLVELRDKQRGPMTLYAMGWSVDGPLKIGIAENIKTRLAGAQTHCPWLLHVYFQYTCFRSIVKDMERDLHETFADKRLRGEWFNVSLVDFCAELTFM